MMTIGYYFSCDLFYESGIPDLSVPETEGKVHVPYPNTPSRRPPRARKQDSFIPAHV